MNMAMHSPFHGQLRHNEPMSRHCSWRTGGTADLYYEPVDAADLMEFLKTLTPDTPVTWVGLGSNLLVRDGGVRGVVIAVLNRMKKISLLEDGRVYAECGATCASLARFCQKHGLGEADFLAGIPGTVGGALAMNAGAFGFEIWRFVDAVDMISQHGQLIYRGRDEFEVDYRSVVKKEPEWFAAGYLRFPSRDPRQESNIKGLLAKRQASQPIGLPSCGSVFMNPPGDYAARLIEAAGLKGFCIGGACVSEKHANFIINDNDASAADIERLIGEVRKRVRQQFDIELHTEVRIIGEPV